MKALLVPLAVGLLVLTACAGWQTHTKAAAGVIESTAPFLPPPFGLIAGAVATALTAVASIGANKVSNAAYAKDKKASPLIRLATDHASTIFTVALPVLISLRASGAINFSDGELITLSTALGAPVVAKKVLRRKA